MWRVRYCVSSDKLLQIVKSDPSAVFDGPHMGYLLFLFGEADRDVAAWIRENLYALDSLTGPDIAGAVFVKSFNLENCLYRGDEETGSRNVDISDIVYSDSPEYVAQLLVDQKRRRKHHNIPSALATTYASDAIARSLGLVAHLPCIVFLDAIPNKVVPLHLNKKNLDSVIDILRKTIGNFMDNPEYARCREIIKNTGSIGLQVRAARRRLDNINMREKNEIDKIKYIVVDHFDVARCALITGSARNFIRALSKTNIDRTAITLAAERVTQKAKSLNHICKTIRGVQYYKKFAKWPLDQNDINRFNNIYEDHISAILHITSNEKIDVTRSFIDSMLHELQNRLDHLVRDIWGDLPDPVMIRAEQDNDISKARKLILPEKQETQVILNDLSYRLNTMIDSLARGPCLTECFTHTAKQFGIHDIQQFDRSEHIMREVLSAITNGTITVVNGDLYVGKNVAAMGSSPSAFSTTIQND